MSNAQLVRMAMAKLGVNISAFAQLIGVKQTTMSYKLKNDSFTSSDMQDIAEKIGAKYVPTLIFDDGTVIK